MKDELKQIEESKRAVEKMEKRLAPEGSTISKNNGGIKKGHLELIKLGLQIPFKLCYGLQIRNKNKEVLKSALNFDFPSVVEVIMIIMFKNLD